MIMGHNMTTERGTVCGMPGARTPEEAYRMYDEQYWKPEPPSRAGPRGGCLFAALGFSIVIVCVVAVYAAHGAELMTFTTRPPQRALVIESMQLGRFGTYSDEYYARRWKRMCAGSARYEAMREANDRGRPMPCGQ